MRIAALCCLSLLIFPFMKETQAEEEPRQQSLELREVLWREGKRLDCYFTLEFPMARKEALFELPNVRLKPISPDSVESLVKSLQEQVPEAHFVVRDSKPPVIHNRDRRLLKAEGYPLDEILKLSFEGTPASLSDEIERRLPKLKLIRGAASGDYLADTYTPVKLKEAEGPVREILTRAVPLEGYSRILWRAISKRLDNGEWSIHLMHYGPREVDGETE